MEPVRTSFSRLFSFGAGGLSALLLILGMPGLTGWWPLLTIALVPLLSATGRLPLLRCGCMGMFCGLLYNIGLLYWIVIVLGRYGGLAPWISVPAMTLLALYMSLYMGLFCLLLAVLLRWIGRGRTLTVLIPAAPVLWVALDYLRSFLFSGFPWMDLGYGLYSQPLLLQAADLGGHHLLTFILVLVNALVVWLIDRLRGSGSRHPHSADMAAVAGCIVLLAIGCYSFLRYRQVQGEQVTGLRATVTVVQGNISQDRKWTAGRKEETVGRYLDLSRSGMEGKEVDLLVWPETALPFYPRREPLMAGVLDFVRRQQVSLLVGAPFFVVRSDKADRGKEVDYYNSALLINPEGRLTGRYDKQHLVPFGEYVPLRPFLPFLEPLVVAVGDFTAGSSFEPLPAGKVAAGVLICFESIFPEISRQEVAAGANLLVNLTNDAWYGRSSAPYHSMAMSVLRAVETRRSLVRAANTGISGFVDPTGRIRTGSQLFVQAALTESVALVDEQTFFVRGGHRFGAICLLFIWPLLLAGWLAAARRHK